MISFPSAGFAFALCCALVVALSRGGIDTNLATYYATRLEAPVPRLASVTPSEGPVVGGTTLTISGYNFRYTSLLRCRFAEQHNPQGTVWDVAATFVSESQILCVTPYFYPLASDCASLSSGNKCAYNIWITVTNDQQVYSGYLASRVGSWLEYGIWMGPPNGGGTLAINYQNTTTTPRGQILLTLTATRATSATVPTRPSSFLRCLFKIDESAVESYSATVATYISSSSLVDTIQCRTPDYSAGLAAGTASSAGSVRLAYLKSDASYDVSAATKATLTFANPTHADNVPSDLWLFTRTDLSHYLQRAPMWGNTEVTIRGKNLYPSESARCLFWHTDSKTWRTSYSLCDTTNGWTYCTRASDGGCCTTSHATFVSLTPTTASETWGYYKCMSPRHQPETLHSAYTETPGIAVDMLFGLEDLSTFSLSANVPIGSLGYSALLSRPSVMNMWLRIADLYVSPSGSDMDLDDPGSSTASGGDGSPQRPYRTVQRAIDRAIVNSRSPSDYATAPYGLLHGQPGAKGTDQQFGRDLIVLHSGLYTGPGNIGLRTREKLLTIRAEWLHNNFVGISAYTPGATTEVLVDCKNSGQGFIEDPAQRYWDNNDNAEREAVIVQGVATKSCLNRRIYSAYDWKNQRNVLHQNPMVSYHAPDTTTTTLRAKRSVHPYANRFEPGWGGEPAAAAIP